MGADVTEVSCREWILAVWMAVRGAQPGGRCMYKLQAE